MSIWFKIVIMEETVGVNVEVFSTLSHSKHKNNIVIFLC